MTPKEYRSLKAEAKRIGLPIPDERFGRNRAGANNIRLFWVSNGKERHRDFAVLREARAAVPANATDWSIHEVWHPSFPGRGFAHKGLVSRSFLGNRLVCPESRFDS
jgi:hypothetical protein